MRITNRAWLARKLVEMTVPIGLGLVLGSIVLLASELPSKWAGMAIVAAMVPAVVLLVNDLDKLLLIVLVIDIPLGLDVALANRLGHIGGPAGFLVSLMTIALIVGYARWLQRELDEGQPKIYVHKGVAIPALVYLFAVLMSAFQATDTWFTFTRFFLDFQFFLMYLYVINHVKTWSDMRLVVTTLVVCLLVESIVMIMQYYTGFQLSALSVETQAIESNVASATSRVAGTLGGANLAATFLAASMAIAFAGYLTDGLLVNKRLALFAFFAGIVALVMTQSRNGWIAFVVAMLILAVQAVRRRVGTRAILILGVLMIMIVAGFSAIIIERFTTDDRSSAESRVWYNQLALGAIQDHMFLGVGANNQRFVVDDNKYAPPELIGEDRAEIHNTYLAIWVEIGVFGFLAFVWLLLAAGGRSFVARTRTKSRYASIILTSLLAALTVFMIHMVNATFTGRRMQFVWFVVALIVAMSQIALKTADEPILESEESERPGLTPAADTPRLISSRCVEKPR